MGISVEADIRAGSSAKQSGDTWATDDCNSGVASHRGSDDTVRLDARLGIVSALLAMRSDPNVCSLTGKTALSEACRSADLELCLLLLDYNAEVTPAALQVANSHPKVAALLTSLENGPAFGGGTKVLGAGVAARLDR